MQIFVYFTWFIAKIFSLRSAMITFCLKKNFVLIKLVEIYVVNFSAANINRKYRGKCRRLLLAYLLIG